MAGAPWLRLLAAALLLAAAEALRRTPAETLAEVPPQKTLLEEWGRNLGEDAEESIEPANDMAHGSAGAALELAVSEVIQELHPLDGVPVPVAAPADEPAAASMAKQRNTSAPDFLRWIWGAHHKAGTNLLRYLALEQAHQTHTEICASYGLQGFQPASCNKNREKEARIWFRCNFSPVLTANLQETGTRFRGVHIMRDPLAMVVSGYLYHMHADDTPASLLKIRNMSMVEGLAVEADFVMTTSAQDMLNTYLFAPKEVLHVRFEYFTQSSDSFDLATRVVYHHMVGGYMTDVQKRMLMKNAKNHDLRRNQTDDKNGIVSDTDLKAQVREVLEQIPEKLLFRLKNIRVPLGYSRTLASTTRAPPA